MGGISNGRGQVWDGAPAVCHSLVSTFDQCELKWSIGSVLQPKQNTKRQRMSGGLPAQYWTGVALKGGTTPRGLMQQGS